MPPAFWALLVVTVCFVVMAVYCFLKGDRYATHRPLECAYCSADAAYAISEIPGQHPGAHVMWCGNCELPNNVQGCKIEALPHREDD